MNSSTSYRTWIGFNDNSDSGITVYTVACQLSDGLQANVFSFETDAYLFLVDLAEGLTDALRIELEQLIESPDREAFWTLFNECVSPMTTYRIETHNLQIAAQPFQGMNNFDSERAAKAARFPQLAETHANIATGRHFGARERLKDLTRIDQHLAKAKEHHDKAEYFRRRAAAAESKRTIFSDDPDATEKLVDKIERLKQRQGAMKRANQLIRKADREGSPTSDSLRKQSPNFLRKILPAELASPITPSSTIRPTSADLRSAWPQSRTPRTTKPRKSSFLVACAWSITSRQIDSKSFSLKFPRNGSAENSSATGFTGPRLLEPGNGTAATAQPTSPN